MTFMNVTKAWGNDYDDDAGTYWLEPCLNRKNSQKKKTKQIRSSDGEMETKNNVRCCNVLLIPTAS